jgi:hypothetical protein
LKQLEGLDVVVVIPQSLEGVVADSAPIPVAEVADAVEDVGEDRTPQILVEGMFIPGIITQPIGKVYHKINGCKY